jgi:hypothetical protein
MRRRAPLHYWAKAQNARFAAYVIWTVQEQKGVPNQYAEQLGHDGDLLEAFYREASLALELIIKTVIAQRIEMGRAMDHVVKVRPIHDLDKLWLDAQLPPLPRADQHRLLIAKRTLHWSGRYAAPRRDEQADMEREEMEPLEEKQPFGKLFLTRGRSFNWDDFDRIYQVAAMSFAER